MEAWKNRTLSRDQAVDVARLMHSHSIVPAISLANNVSYKDVGNMLDVGGGSGCFSIALAKRNPNLRCTIMDFPAMCEVAMEYVAEAGVSDRVSVCAADMFQENWPSGHDLIFFSNVFHDWNAEACTELARRAYNFLPVGGRINLHEMLREDGDSGKRIPAAFSVLMSTFTDGKQFTFEELGKLLTSTGFVDVDHTFSSAFFSLVSARK